MKQIKGKILNMNLRAIQKNKKLMKNPLRKISL